MFPGKSRRGRRPAVSASALAEMGVCERRMVFDHRYGRQCSAARRQAMTRGRRFHGLFYRLGLLQSMLAGLGVPLFVRGIGNWIRRLVRGMLKGGRRRGRREGHGD